MKKNGKLRKKLVGMAISAVVCAIALLLIGLVPAFQSADYKIADNQLIVERTNKYNTNMSVVLNVIDAKGNVEKETVKIYFDDQTKLNFDQEYFKRLLQTDDDVYLVEVDSALITTFSNFTPFVSTMLVILFIISIVAGAVFIGFLAY